MSRRALISFEVSFGWKAKQFSFLWENFRIPCYLLISRLNGDGFIENESRNQTTGTTSVSICRPAYCFTRTCGKNVLGTKVLGNAVPERTTTFDLPAVQRPQIITKIIFTSTLFIKDQF